MLPEFPVIIADESVEGRIIRNLINRGFTVIPVITETPGISDAEVINIAVIKRGFIITEDKDFGGQLAYKNMQSIGSMLLRMAHIPIEARVRLVIETIEHYADDLKNSFSVLTSKKLRIRKYT